MYGDRVYDDIDEAEEFGDGLACLILMLDYTIILQFNESNLRNNCQ